MTESLKKQIRELTDQILEIQAQCSHPKPCVVSKYLGDFDDDFGGFISMGKTRYDCTLCGKTWVEGPDV